MLRCFRGDFLPLFLLSEFLLYIVERERDWRKFSISCAPGSESTRTAPGAAVSCHDDIRLLNPTYGEHRVHRANSIGVYILFFFLLSQYSSRLYLYVGIIYVHIVMKTIIDARKSDLYIERKLRGIGVKFKLFPNKFKHYIYSWISICI